MLIYGSHGFMKIGGTRDIAPDGKSPTAKSLDLFDRSFQSFAGFQVEATDRSAGFRFVSKLQPGERSDPDLNDERRRYYRITRKGRRAAMTEAERLQGLVRAARAKHLLPRPKAI